ncbi:MAG: hypothetical protein KJ626_02760, partial [Verrucomicrobia bacterium]|nr:hypothetical protein [Verrucomicrobiota bacterium]
NRRNVDLLKETAAVIEDARFDGWLVQLTLPDGRAATTGAGIALLPSELPHLEEKLVAVASETTGASWSASM